MPKNNKKRVLLSYRSRFALFELGAEPASELKTSLLEIF